MSGNLPEHPFHGRGNEAVVWETAANWEEAKEDDS